MGESQSGCATRNERPASVVVAAEYVETLDEATTGEIVARVVSVIDPVRE